MTHFYDRAELEDGLAEKVENVGTWLAVLYVDDFAWTNFAEVMDLYGEAYDSPVSIYVVRGTALPVNGRPPSVCDISDIAHEIECDLVNEDDESLGAAERFRQAQAMAAGLNAAG